MRIIVAELPRYKDRNPSVLIVRLRNSMAAFAEYSDFELQIFMINQQILLFSCIADSLRLKIDFCSI